MSKTPTGKLRSRTNALKHGLRATDELLLAHLNSSERNILDNIRKSLDKDYNPQTEPEKILVDRIAIQYFRLYRLYKIENLAVRRTTRTSPACESIIPHLDRFARYDARIDKQINSLHERLRSLYYSRRLAARNSNPQKE